MPHLASETGEECAELWTLVLDLQYNEPVNHALLSIDIFKLN